MDDVRRYTAPNGLEYKVVDSVLNCILSVSPTESMNLRRWACWKICSTATAA